VQRKQSSFNAQKSKYTYFGAGAVGAVFRDTQCSVKEIPGIVAV